MFTLRKFSGRTGSLGVPLDDPFEVFDRRRIKFRMGGTSLIAGAPGSFKSVLALNMLTKWAPEHSILYFSADSDEFTVAKRLSSILSGEDTYIVEERMQQQSWRDWYTEKILPAVDNARFVYRALDFDVIQNHLAAYEAVNGAFPEIVFIDNLLNTVEDPTDWGGMISFLKQADILSRETRSHVCVLHHASEAWAQSNPGMPPPSWAIQGKVNQIPRLVLTLGASGKYLKLACVKNTNGPQDPQAKDYLSLSVEPSLRVEPF